LRDLVCVIQPGQPLDMDVHPLTPSFVLRLLLLPAHEVVMGCIDGELAFEHLSQQENISTLVCADCKLAFGTTQGKVYTGSILFPHSTHAAGNGIDAEFGGGLTQQE
jgi:hypothetical protein